MMYMLVYAVMNMGAFACVALLSEREDRPHFISDLRGQVVVVNADEGSAQSGLAPLRHASEEASRVLATYDGDRATLLSGSDASLERLAASPWPEAAAEHPDALRWRDLTGTEQSVADLRGRVVVREERGELGAESDARRPGQRGEIDEERRRLARRLVERDLGQ